MHKNLDETLKSAATRAIGIEEKGTISAVLVPANEYASLRALVGRAMQSSALADIVKDLTAASPGAHPHSPERYDDAKA
ncbi:hypothetical protein [Blastomonas sp. CCH8-A3]|uniref:hypothetical protein n=1 Tax=Blastomonas sp. CCH8-A3 TaxID=1768743 RepID=UPI000826EFAF|nr:hypothetical protein [Blastomonas sp. CCH8-A3]